MTDPTANDTEGFAPDCEWHGAQLCDRRGRPILECNDCKRWFCDLHVNNHVCSSVWPPTSERDAHLEAYHRPEPGFSTSDPAPCTTAEQQLACPWRWAYNEHIGAPAGLTAAQEIRLRLVELTDWSQCTNTDQFDRQWSNSEHALRALAAWVEHGPDETPQIRDWAAACPDPALHDPSARTALGLQIDALAEWIVDNVPGEPRQSEGAVATAMRVMAELKTELLEAHADFEASQAREQIAAERVAGMLVAVRQHTDDGTVPAPPTLLNVIRAILAGDQGEEATG